MYVCMCVCVCVCMRVYSCVCMHIYIYMCVFVCVCVYMYMCAYHSHTLSLLCPHNFLLCVRGFFCLLCVFNQELFVCVCGRLFFLVLIVCIVCVCECSTAATGANMDSSRSHAVLQVCVYVVCVRICACRTYARR